MSRRSVGIVPVPSAPTFPVDVLIPHQSSLNSSSAAVSTRPEKARPGTVSLVLTALMQGRHLPLLPTLSLDRHDGDGSGPHAGGRHGARSAGSDPAAARRRARWAPSSRRDPTALRPRPHLFLWPCQGGARALSPRFGLRLLRVLEVRPQMAVPASVRTPRRHLPLRGPLSGSTLPQDRCVSSDQPAARLSEPSFSGSAGSRKPIAHFTARRRERSSSVKGSRSIT